MSTTAPTQRPQVDDAARAADLLATVRQWHATHPQHILAAQAADLLAQDSDAYIPSEPVRHEEGAA